jgi:Ca2+-binding RTX toxin-like protein
MKLGGMWLRRRTGFGVALASALTVACGGGGSDGPSGDVGGLIDGATTSSEAGDDAATTGGGDGGNGGKDAGAPTPIDSGACYLPVATAADAGGATSDGASGDGGAGANAAASSAFDGLPLTTLPADPVDGCVGAFDATKGALTLAIGSGGHALVVDAYQGYVRANGVACTGSDGAAIVATSVRSLAISGTDGDDVVTLDLYAGFFGKQLLGSAGAITVDGGKGADRFELRTSSCADAVHASSGASGTTIDAGLGVGSITLTQTESLLVDLGPGADSFNGKGSSPLTLPVTVYGSAGDDTIAGGSAADVLNGGADDDTFDVSAAAGADVLNGGDGSDTVDFSARTAALTLNLCTSSVSDGCSGAACTCAPGGEAGEKLTLVNLENVQGGSGADQINGSSADEMLSGGPGNDTINGGGGDDQIYGDEDNDTILGGDGDDIIEGGAGVDSIDGQAGDNICFYTSRDPIPKNCATAIMK